MPTAVGALAPAPCGVRHDSSGGKRPAAHCHPRARGDSVASRVPATRGALEEFYLFRGVPAGAFAAAALSLAALVAAALPVALFPGAAFLAALFFDAALPAALFLAFAVPVALGFAVAPFRAVAVPELGFAAPFPVVPFFAVALAVLSFAAPVFPVAPFFAAPFFVADERGAGFTGAARFAAFFVIFAEGIAVGASPAPAVSRAGSGGDFCRDTPASARAFPTERGSAARAAVGTGVWSAGGAGAAAGVATGAPGVVGGTTMRRFLNSLAAARRSARLPLRASLCSSSRSASVGV